MTDAAVTIGLGKWKMRGKISHSPIFHYSLIGIELDAAMKDEILTLKEVAEYLKLADKTAYRLAAEGKLPGFKVGGSWRFRRQELEEWIAERHRPDRDRDGENF